MATCRDISQLAPGCADYRGGFDKVYIQAKKNVSSVALSTVPGLENTIGAITMVSSKYMELIKTELGSIVVTETLTGNGGTLEQTIVFTVPGTPASSNTHWDVINELTGCKCGLDILLQQEGDAADGSEDIWKLFGSEPDSATSILTNVDFTLATAVSNSGANRTESQNTVFTFTRTTIPRGYGRAVSQTTAQLKAANVIR